MNTGSPDWSLSTALKAFKAVSPEGGHISSTPAGPNMKLSILGMQRISGWVWIIRPFLYPVSGRILDMATEYQAEYLVIEKAGYPAKYAAKEKHINTAYTIIQSFVFM